MKTYRISIKCILLLVPFIFASCEDNLQEDPKGLLSSGNFWDNDNNAIGAVNAIYSTPMEPPNRELTWNFWFETAAEDFGHFDKKHPHGMANGTWDSSKNPFWDLWKSSYRSISRANFVLSNINTADVSEDLKLRLEGEASFLRALHYFNLARAYGDVPLLLKQTDGSDNLLVSRTPVQEVYNAIIADLEIAMAQLPLRNEYAQDDLGRATKGAAQSLLAKVYLTLGDYQKTVDLTGKVIASGEYALEPEFKDVFTAEKDTGIEWIFSYASSGESAANSHITASFGFPNSLGAYGFKAGFGNLVLSLDLVSLYSSNDKRFTDMVWNEYVAPDGTVVKFDKGTGYYSKKYYDLDFSKTLSLTRINYPILRYPDVLLMYAEALNEVSPLSGDAFAKLNIVRNRAGLDDLTQADLGSKQAFLDEVLDERRREFVDENQRLWDLKRRGMFLDYVKQFPYSEHKGHMDLFPIPQNEIDANPNLVQNPGY